MTKLQLILFSADWCGYCQKFKPEWDNIVQYAGATKNIRTTLYKHTDNVPAHLAGLKDRGYPTLVLVYKGDHIIYDRERNAGAVYDFAYELINKN